MNREYMSVWLFDVNFCLSLNLVHSWCLSCIWGCPGVIWDQFVTWCKTSLMETLFAQEEARLTRSTLEEILQLTKALTWLNRWYMYAYILLQQKHFCSVWIKLLTVSVHLVDHVLQLGLCGVLAQRPHDGAKLFGGDCAITILVE